MLCPENISAKETSLTTRRTKTLGHIWCRRPALASSWWPKHWTSFSTKLGCRIHSLLQVCMVKVQHLQLWIHKEMEKQGLRARWDGPIRNSWLPIPYTSLIQVCLNGKSAQNLLSLQEIGGNCTKMFTVHHFETYIHPWILDRQKVISHPTLANPLRLRNRMPTLFLSEEKIGG